MRMPRIAIYPCSNLKTKAGGVNIYVEGLGLTKKPIELLLEITCYLNSARDLYISQTEDRDTINRLKDWFKGANKLADLWMDYQRVYSHTH